LCVTTQGKIRCSLLQYLKAVFWLPSGREIIWSTDPAKAPSATIKQSANWQYRLTTQSLQPALHIFQFLLILHDCWCSSCLWYSSRRKRVSNSCWGLPKLSCCQFPQHLNISQKVLTLHLHFIYIWKIQALSNDGWIWNMSNKYTLGCFTHRHSHVNNNTWYNKTQQQYNQYRSQQYNV
jgi:hypothetical protein